MTCATLIEDGNRSPSLGGWEGAMCDCPEAAWEASRWPVIEDDLARSAPIFSEPFFRPHEAGATPGLEHRRLSNATAPATTIRPVRNKVNVAGSGTA